MNKMISLVVAVLAVALVAGWSGRAALAQQAEDAAVRAVVEQYFHGIIAYDEAALRAAFHPEANVTGVKETGELDWAAFDSWVVYTRGEAPDPTGRNNRIVSVDIAGPAALVKTELDWPSVKYIDYLSLLKIDGEWKIVNKIWSRERPQ